MISVIDMADGNLLNGIYQIDTSTSTAQSDLDVVGVEMLTSSSVLLAYTKGTYSYLS